MPASTAAHTEALYAADSSSSWVVCLLESRAGSAASHELGLAAIELTSISSSPSFSSRASTTGPSAPSPRTPAPPGGGGGGGGGVRATRLELAQFCDSQTFVKCSHWLRSHWPLARVVVPHTALASSSCFGAASGSGTGTLTAPATRDDSLLVRCIREALATTSNSAGGGGAAAPPAIVPLARRFWSADDVALDELARLLKLDPSSGHQKPSATRSGGGGGGGADAAEAAHTLHMARNKRYALMALGALLTHTNASYGPQVLLPSPGNESHSPPSIRVRFAPLDGTLALDQDTVTHLELVQNLTDPKSNATLFGHLDRCQTPMGQRLLRVNVLAPLTNVETIDRRLDAVEELIDNDDRLHSVSKALGSLRRLDLDRIIARVVAAQPRESTLVNASSAGDPTKVIETKLACVLGLRTVLVNLPALRGALAGSSSNLLTTVEALFGDSRTTDMLSQIDAVVDLEAARSIDPFVRSGQGGGGAGGGKGVGRAAGGALAVRNARLNAVRAECHPFLAVARESFRENMDDCMTLAQELAAEHELPIKLRYVSPATGFVCEMPTQASTSRRGANEKDSDDEPASELKPPKGAINVVRKARRIEFGTVELRKRNAKLLESVQEILLHSEATLDTLLESVRSAVPALYRCSEALAMLDILASFALTAVHLSYVRPEWTDTLAIKDGRHPLVERFGCADGSFVPNDTYASDTSRFTLVFGANMSGKSVYLRQVALIQILAQMGSFVPAEYASLVVVDAIASRFGNNDDISANLSTFAVEMRAMSSILATVQSSQRSLVLVDELGRGTSPEEGVGLAHALAEQIILACTRGGGASCCCFFATHFKALAHTLSGYTSVSSVHLEAEMSSSGDEDERAPTFSHRVRDGVTTLSHYGLQMSKLVGLPPGVVSRATEIAHEIDELNKPSDEPTDRQRYNIRRRLLINTYTALEQLKDSRTEQVSRETLLTQLRELQDSFIVKVAGLLSNATSDAPHDAMSSDDASVASSSIAEARVVNGEDEPEPCEDRPASLDGEERLGVRGSVSRSISHCSALSALSDEPVSFAEIMMSDLEDGGTDIDLDEIAEEAGSTPFDLD